MSVQTPRRLVRPRPTPTPTPAPADPSPPPLSTRDLAARPRPPHAPAASTSPTLGEREALARKASLNQLTSNSLASIPDGTAAYARAAVDGHDRGAPSSPPPALSTATMAPVTPAGPRAASTGTGAIEIGDAVDVPGGMHGTVKFIGSVKGKKGVFAGVELSRDFASRGKNDGDVDGTRYFTTSLPNSGIFLPLGRASRRASPTVSLDSFPPTPTTPSAGSGFNLGGPGRSDAGPAAAANNAGYTPPTPSAPKFSQSVGPGRAPSPQFKPKSRPSLPRPESPLRKNQNMLATPGGRPSLGAAGAASATNGTRYAASPTPGKFGASLGRRVPSGAAGQGGDPGKKTARPGAKAPGGPRTASALGSRHVSLEEADGDGAPIGLARTGDATGRRSSSGFTARARPGSGQADEESHRLRGQIEERDRQLKEQAASLAEMEDSFAELQSLLPGNGSDVGRSGKRGSGESDAPHLRGLLREKNEKIALLTAEFDAHRADFRSTIDTLELASTETERVYERRVEELKEEVRELQERSEDVESVARQLKQLEELVQELEEGLEDARRGEAEARGEVEFLRGEVERGRSELRREREKAAAALKGAGAAVDGGAGAGAGGGGGGGAKEVEQRDDEIRGLKAIIHSLSRDAVPDAAAAPGAAEGGTTPPTRRPGSLPRANGPSQRASLQLSEERLARESLQREVKELHGLVERKSYREEQLEQELRRLRRGSGSGPAAAGQRGSSRSNGLSERTVTPSHRSSGRGSGSRGAAVGGGWRDERQSPGRGPQEPPLPDASRESSDADGGGSDREPWCEICETTGHDILTCTNMFGNQRAAAAARTAALDNDGPPMGMRRSGNEGVEALRVQGEQGAAASPASPLPPAPAVPMPNPTEPGMVAGKASGVIDPDRWCALCERDGHESVDCPFEDAF